MINSINIYTLYMNTHHDDGTNDNDLIGIYLNLDEANSKRIKLKEEVNKHFRYTFFIKKHLIIDDEGQTIVSCS